MVYALMVSATSSVTDSPPGFTGDLCWTNIDESDCIDMNCSGNGVCIDGIIVLLLAIATRSLIYTDFMLQSI